MFKPNKLLLFFSLLALPCLVFAEESITITTYYPSPYGSYNELTTASNTYLATSSGRVGIGTTSFGGDEFFVVQNAVADQWTATLRNTSAGPGGAYGLRIDTSGYNPSSPAFAIYSDNPGTDSNIFRVTNAGNVGIGTASPGEKLEVNGAIKFTGDGSVISRAPRVVETRDTRAGCPPAYTANTNIFTQSYTTSRPATVRTIVNIIACTGGRHDLYFLVDGVEKDRTLASPNGAGGDCWVGMQLESAYTVATGAHTVAVRGTATNTYGCGSTWGHISSVIFE